MSSLMVGSLAAIAVLAAACSSGQSASTTTKPTAAASSASTKSVKLASSSIPGVGSVLAGPNGRTLYYFTTDSSTSTSCTGQCAVVWPPLVVPAGAQPALASGVSGTLGTVMRPDGSTQVTYNGHLVYYYQGDTAAGQDKGQGVDGTWFVLTTSGSSAAAGSTTTTTSGGGGGGVGF
jgi:predicted lipoprotein with Yx(FWY)xxD motif